LTRGLIAAAACLPAGFGVAVATGIRPLGGVVLVLLAVLAGRWAGRELRQQSRWYAVVLVCFVISHLLALAIGAWPAVGVVTVIATASYAQLLSSRAREAVT
jgi:hypothetical protein